MMPMLTISSFPKILLSSSDQITRTATRKMIVRQKVSAPSPKGISHCPHWGRLWGYHAICRSIDMAAYSIPVMLIPAIAAVMYLFSCFPVAFSTIWIRLQITAQITLPFTAFIQFPPALIPNTAAGHASAPIPGVICSALKNEIPTG